MPICFKSRACRGAERNYGSAEGELLAAVWAIGKLRQYLRGEEFKLVTDSKALSALKVTTNMHGKLARWAMLLSEYNYQVEHRSGAKMGNVDGMNRSHLPEEPLQLEDEQLQEIWEMGLAAEEDGLWAQEAYLEGEVERVVNELNLARKEVLAGSDYHKCKGGKLAAWLPFTNFSKLRFCAGS